MRSWKIGPKVPGHRPSSVPWLRVVLLVGLVLTAGPGAPRASAQETEGPLAPAGRLRVEVAPVFVSWDHRFGLRTEDGRSLEGTEPLGFDLTREEAASLFPGVSILEDLLPDLLGEPFDGAFGSTSAVVSADRSRVPVRVDLGVTDWLTLGATVPFVKSRTEIAFAYDSTGANLGVSPSLTDPGLVTAYVEELAGAMETADALAEDACATDPTSVECQTAEALATDVTLFLNRLSGAYGGSFLFPTASSAAGESLQALSDELDQRLRDAGLAGFGTSLPLSDRLTGTADFNEFLQTHFPTAPLENRPGRWEVGDVELHGAVRLHERIVRDSTDGAVRARWHVGAGLLVRLGTGTTNDPDSLLRLGSGDGQTDVEGRIFGNGAWGSFGLWADARYGIQLSSTLTRRIGPPDLVLRTGTSRAEVEWTPGDYLQLELVPRYHLTPELAFAASYRFFRKGEDGFERRSPDVVADDPLRPRGPSFGDASLLERETEETVHHVGGGLVYSTLEAWREDRTSLPLQARFGVTGAVAGSGGQTPKTVRFRLGIRLYHRFWGR